MQELGFALNTDYGMNIFEILKSLLSEKQLCHQATFLEMCNITSFFSFRTCKNVNHILGPPPIYLYALLYAWMSILFQNSDELETVKCSSERI